MNRKCFLCGRSESSYNPMEMHHIFGAAYRKKSTKYKLVVPLCHCCHNEPPEGVHHNIKNMRKLQRYGQRKIMREQGWSIEEFIHQFGRNYID